MSNIIFKVADITQENVCAIVNAANSSLLGGGGVDGAIHRAGGEQILNECKKLIDTTYPHGLPTGNAVATTAGNMRAKYVIHTVGPVYSSCKNRCEELLSNCYISSLECAKELGCDTVSFPAISTGIYGYPKDKAAKVAYEAVRSYLKENSDMKVNFLFSTQKSYDIFLDAVKSLKNKSIDRDML
jgi:O-acetyl-ADP-ribose deacetylase (regulator of RNase III)